MARNSVFLIDDNRFFLRLAARFLKNYAELDLVGSATDAAEALARTAELQPNFVLLDLNLSEASGLSLIPKLRQAAPQAKIIVLTLWESPIYREAALLAGADEFVPKALMNTDLMPAMRRLRPALALGD